MELSGINYHNHAPGRSLPVEQSRIIFSGATLWTYMDAAVHSGRLDGLVLRCMQRLLLT